MIYDNSGALDEAIPLDRAMKQLDEIVGEHDDRCDCLSKHPDYADWPAKFDDNALAKRLICSNEAALFLADALWHDELSAYILAESGTRRVLPKLFREGYSNAFMTCSTGRLSLLPEKQREIWDRKPEPYEGARLWIMKPDWSKWIAETRKRTHQARKRGRPNLVREAVKIHHERLSAGTALEGIEEALAVAKEMERRGLPAPQPKTIRDAMTRDKMRRLNSNGSEIL